MSPDELHNRPSDTSANGDAGRSAEALVDRLTAAVRDTAVPDGPDERTLAVTLLALRDAQAAGEPPASARPDRSVSQPRKIFTMKLITRLTIAACLVLAVGAVFLTN